MITKTFVELTVGIETQKHTNLCRHLMHVHVQKYWYHRATAHVVNHRTDTELCTVYLHQHDQGQGNNSSYT